MTTSIDVEKAFERKTLISFMIKKKSKQTRNKTTFLNLIKNYYKKNLQLTSYLVVRH
jgi:hypothetical protein